MNDCELLEYAAKAAGVEIVEFFGANYSPTIRSSHGSYVGWNPLTDDGDALRLAVKLNMTLAVGVARGDAGEATEFDLSDNKPYAATRRAIVRAAAEIGKAME